jgi:hypothetical protein
LIDKSSHENPTDSDLTVTRRIAAHLRFYHEVPASRLIQPNSVSPLNPVGLTT